MKIQDTRQAATEKNTRRALDLPELIKFILLFLLIMLLLGEIYAGEFSRIKEIGWLIWCILFIKIILIIGLIILIWVQRNLICRITAPTGCTEEEVDPSKGLFVKVMGTASGWAFGHYTLEVKKGAISYPGIVSYPPGGGAVPVNSGELGRINTMSLSDGAYDIVLTVYPAGAGVTKICTTSFDLLKAVVYINRVGKVQTISMSPIPNNANPFDTSAELRVESPLGSGNYVPVAVGGLLSIEGSAYIYECANRKIKKYGIRSCKVTAPGTEPAQPAKDDPIPASFTNLVSSLEYVSADYYQPWTRVGIAPRELINSWNVFTIAGNTYYKLNPGNWNSDANSGRYSLLLTAEDTAGHLYHDIQHTWLDNLSIIGKIVKFQWKNPQTNAWEDIPRCEDFSLKKHGKIRIMGLAWDPVIDEAWWPPVAPNDNFDYYRIDFWKQFGSSNELIGNTNTRVPALPAAAPVTTPTDADADELAVWDLTTLDAGPKPTPYVAPPDPKIYRGDACTYYLQLFVTDKSMINNRGTTHYQYYAVPVKVINDL